MKTASNGLSGRCGILPDELDSVDLIEGTKRIQSRGNYGALDGNPIESTATIDDPQLQIDG